MAKAAHPHFFSPFPELITNRLELRKTEPADAREIFLLRSDDRVNRYIARAKAETVEDGLRFIHKINIGISNDEWIYWAIVPKGQDTLVGTICIWNWNKQQHTAELGFELMPAFQGKGYMHEALQRVLDYAFHNMQIQRIEAWSHPDNQRSLHLLEKNQFFLDEHNAAAASENMLAYYRLKS